MNIRKIIPFAFLFKTKKKKLQKQPLKFFSLTFLLPTICGIGKFPLFPGTIGSLVAIIEFYCYISIMNWGIYKIITMVFIIVIISFYAIQNYINYSSNTDPKEVIIDEYIGQHLAIFIVYIVFNHINQKVVFINEQYVINYPLLILSFTFFRLFDILKPYPVSYFDEKFHNSFGVIMDDVVAAVMASIATILIYFIYTVAI